MRRPGARGIHPNGAKISRLRRQSGLSQQGFAARFAVTTRTLQRAESGAPILPEMLNAIAAGLKVASAELVLDAPEAVHAPRVDPCNERVRLRRTASAREITAALSEARDVAFEYDVDPDEATAEHLAEAAEIVMRLTKPPEGRMDEPASVVRRLGRLNRLLAALAARGISFFVGTYWEPVVTVEDEAGPGRKLRYCRIERICRGLVCIGHARGRYRTKLVARTYADEQINRSIEELRRYGWVVEDLRDTAAQVPAIQL